MSVRSVVAVLVALCVVGAAVPQERVVQVLSTEQLEQLLKGLSLEFKKSGSRQKDGVFYYDFQLVKNRFNARLHYFQGRDIMMDALFPEHPLETLNRWNATQARFTRAAAHKEAKSAYTALEANFNLAGGVSENAVRRFIRDFEEEIAAFDRFLSGKVAPSVAVGPDGDRIITLTTEKLEEIMNRMKLTPKKQSFKGDFIYDYESAKNYKIRLSNMANKDLMLDAVFKKMSLEAINRYNFNRKFIRAVQYSQDSVEYTALEANLDCSVGISENMVRHFLITFEEEVQTFIEYIGKN